MLKTLWQRELGESEERQGRVVKSPEKRPEVGLQETGDWQRAFEGFSLSWEQWKTMEGRAGEC